MIRFRPPLLVPAPVLALQQPYPVRYPRPVPLQPLVLRVSTAQHILAGQRGHPRIPWCFGDRLEPRRVSALGQDGDAAGRSPRLSARTCSPALASDWTSSPPTFPAAPLTRNMSTFPAVRAGVSGGQIR